MDDGRQDSLDETTPKLRLPQGALSAPSGGRAGTEMTAEIVRDWPYARLVAHRGAGKLAPENTLTAMRVGHAHGYRMVEFDVKLSADNLSFLLHDATLERTTSGRGRADALPWRELSRLDAGGWHSAKYAGEPLPTFASIARWARAHGVACNVEIKPMPGRERETGAAVALDAAALWREAEVPPLLSSFSEACARGRAQRGAGAAACAAHRRRAACRTGRIGSRDSTASRSTSITSCSTPRLVRRAHARGLPRALLHAERVRAHRGARGMGRRRHHHRCGRPRPRGLASAAAAARLANIAGRCGAKAEPFGLHTLRRPQASRPTARPHLMPRRRRAA